MRAGGATKHPARQRPTRSLWCAACAAAYSCRVLRRGEAPVDTPAPTDSASRLDMIPDPVIAPIERVAPRVMIGESSRRILWIVGVYRATCAAFLLGTALFVDLHALSVLAPNAFVRAAGLYFLYGLLAFWWVQRDVVPIPLSVLLIS